MHRFLDDVLLAALSELRSNPLDLYTIAFYHDHESRAVSICADTKSKSQQTVRNANVWSMKYFAQQIDDGNLEDAAMFQANTGRSLSLGDFAKVNLARTGIPHDVTIDDEFYLGMVKTMIRHQRAISAMAAPKEELRFCCSTADAEVGLDSTLSRRSDRLDGQSSFELESRTADPRNVIGCIARCRHERGGGRTRARIGEAVS